MIQMMRLKLSGGARCPEVYQDRSHHHQEEEEMAKAFVLAFCYLAAGKRTDKWLPSVCQLIITRLGGYSKLFIIPVGHTGYHHYWLTV